MSDFFSIVAGVSGPPSPRPSPEVEHRQIRVVYLRHVVHGDRINLAVGDKEFEIVGSLQVDNRMVTAARGAAIAGHSRVSHFISPFVTIPPARASARPHTSFLFLLSDAGTAPFFHVPYVPDHSMFRIASPVGKRSLDDLCKIYTA
jgi:hypothetical protein